MPKRRPYDVFMHYGISKIVIAILVCIKDVFSVYNADIVPLKASTPVLSVGCLQSRTLFV